MAKSHSKQMFHSIFQGIHWGKLMEGRKKVWPKSSLCVVSKCVCVCCVPVFPHSIGLFSMPTNIFSQTVSGFSLFENCSPYTHTHTHTWTRMGVGREWVRWVREGASTLSWLSLFGTFGGRRLLPRLARKSILQAPEATKEPKSA